MSEYQRPVSDYFEAQRRASALGLKVEYSTHDGGYCIRERYFIQTPEQSVGKEEYIASLLTIDEALAWLDGHKYAKG